MAGCLSLPCTVPHTTLKPRAGTPSFHLVLASAPLPLALSFFLCTALPWARVPFPKHPGPTWHPHEVWRRAGWLRYSHAWCAGVSMVLHSPSWQPPVTEEHGLARACRGLAPPHPDSSTWICFLSSSFLPQSSSLLGDKERREV